MFSCSRCSLARLFILQFCIHFGSSAIVLQNCLPKSLTGSGPLRHNPRLRFCCSLQRLAGSGPPRHNPRLRFHCSPQRLAGSGPQLRIGSNTKNDSTRSSSQRISSCSSCRRHWAFGQFGAGTSCILLWKVVLHLGFLHLI